MLQNTSHTKAKCNRRNTKKIKHKKENLRNLFSQKLNRP